MAIVAAHGLSSFLSYQCAAAVKAVSSAAVAVTHAVTATTVAVVTTLAVAKFKIIRFLPKGRFSFCIITSIRSKISNGGVVMCKDFFVGYSADINACGVLPVTDPFSENQKSRSKEHADRFIKNENFQKTEKNEDITS